MPGINTNINALNAAASLNSNSVNQATAMQQLSTGLRINSAKDDAAGLAIVTKMSSNIRGVAIDIKNANDGISLAQTAESALSSVTNMLQRMRELAVQASNGTLTDANRASMQIEVSQLTNEIDNIGKTANFNGIKLFTGAAANLTLQTNINQGDTVKLGVSAMNSSLIGTGTRASLTAEGSSNALSSGDLVINGVVIGSSVASSDNASSTGTTASSISKAAAINAQSSLTGVTASVNTNTYSGSQMSASALTGTVTINGVTTASISTTSDAGASRTAVIQAVNAISAQTGVSAVDTGQAGTGVQLVAKDGRNITVAFTTLTAAATGLGAAGTGYGSYSLTSVNGGPITVSSNNSQGSLLKNAGLTAGTFGANTTYVSSKFGTTAADRATVADSSTAPTALSTGDLVINGIAIGPSSAADDTASASVTGSQSKAASAIAIAAAVNKATSQTGVSAVANANVVQISGYAAGSSGTSVYVNGVTVTLAATAADTVTAFNNVSGQTGVVATDAGNTRITLTAADGRNITLNSSAAGTLTVTDGNGTNAAIAAGTSANQGNTFYSTVSLVSSGQITVAGGANSTALTNLGKLGFVEGTFGGQNNGTMINKVDISTLNGATNALAAIDAAVTQISNQRSSLGAIQNRLSSAVDNLTNQSTNLQAAAGRIQDTDYSTVTQALSKSQIIAQAGTAMLAQANQQPQLVLSLLK